MRYKPPRRALKVEKDSRNEARATMAGDMWAGWLEAGGVEFTMVTISTLHIHIYIYIYIYMYICIYDIVWI